MFTYCALVNTQNNKLAIKMVANFFINSNLKVFSANELLGKQCYNNYYAFKYVKGWDFKIIF